MAPWTGVAPNESFSRTTGLQSGANAWVDTKNAGRGVEAVDLDAHDQDIADALNQTLKRDGGNKPTANIDWGGFQIKNVATGTDATDAVNKAQMDAAVTATVNATVRVASTTSITKASAMDNGKSMDGVTLATNDRVLLKNQSTAAENGVWVVAASGAPARATDFDTFAEHVSSVINVTAGSANAGLSYRCTVNAGGTLDSTAITYVQFGTSITLPLGIPSGGHGETTAAAGFNAIKQASTDTYAGVVELATASEAVTGTDTTRAVTPAGLAAAVAAAAGVAIGTVVPYAGASTPALWQLCYGQAISRSTYSALFSAISTTYGAGNGSTTFNVPDLRGRVVAGQDDMGGSSANRLTDQSGGVDGDTLGDTGGAETHTLTEAEMPSHTHGIGSSNTAAQPGNVSRSNPSTNVLSTSAGGDDPHNNVQPTIILNYIIYAGA